MFNNNIFGTGFGPSIGTTGWNNQGVAKQTTPTKQQKFPGLSTDQIKRLESLTSDPQEQQKLYQQAIQQLKQNNTKNNRIAAENEMTYRSVNQTDNKQANYMQSNVRLEQLADLAKDKFGLNQTAKTQDVVNGLMSMAQDEGIGLDSLNDYLESGDETFLYEMGLKEEKQKTLLQKAGQVGTDIVGGAYDSATSLARRGAKGLANVVGWTAKQLGADENKTNELVQSYKDYLDNERSGKSIGADQDSLTYNISKGVGDFAQVFAGEGLLKNAVQGTAKGAQLLNHLKTAPTWQKMVAGGLEGAGDMALYSIVAENKLPSSTEEAIGAGLGAAIPGAGALYKAAKPVVQKALGKTASQLELSGLLNPAKLNAIKDQLVKEGTDLTEAGLKGGKAEDVGNWMIERGFKGDKPTLINNLGEHANKSHKLKREILSASDSLHDVESAKKSLRVIYNTIKNVPGLENRLSRVKTLMAKSKHTLSELDEIKSILDDTKKIYTNAGDVRAGAIMDGLDNVRKDLRKYIEDAATKEGLGNVKLLNNETQIAKGLQDAISRKDSADMAREMLGVFSKTAIGGVAGYNVGPFDSSTLGGKVGNIVVGALAGKYLFSTKAKTNLASYINKMSGGSKKELERLVAGNLSVKKLSKSTQKELASAFEKSGIMEAGTPTEMSAEEYQALLKKYSNSDLPALEFKEGIDDAGKNILAGNNEKIIATPEGVNFREGQIAEIPQQSKYGKDEISSWFKSDSKSQESLGNFLKDLPKFQQKGGNYTLERMLDRLPEYQKAKVEYDAFLDNMAKETGGTALKPSLKIANNEGKINGKGAYRALQKAYGKSNGIEGVTDIVRGTTAAKSKAHMQEMLNWVKKNGIDTDPKFKFDDKFTNPTNLGYKDMSFIYTTKNGVKAEVQINTPNMLVAKEGRDAIDMGIISAEDYEKLIKQVGEEGGKGHKYYEEWRSLYDDIYSGKLTAAEEEKAFKRMAEIEKESTEYYKKFEDVEDLGLDRNQVSSKTATIEEGDQTQTPAFKKWFGKSIGVNENGTPKELYHGTTNGNFDAFDRSRVGRNSQQLGPGFYFTNDPKVAKEYTVYMDKVTGATKKADNPGIKKVYVSLENPLMFDDELIDLGGVKKAFMDGNNDYFFEKTIPFKTEGKEIGGKKRTRSEIEALSKSEKVDLMIKHLMEGINPRDYTRLNQKILQELPLAYELGNRGDVLDKLVKYTGKDGVYSKNYKGLEQYVTWSEGQSKYSKGNAGTFDKSNPDMRK